MFDSIAIVYLENVVIIFNSQEILRVNRGRSKLNELKG